MSGGSSLKDTDFSNDTDLSAIDVNQRIFAWYMCVRSVRSVYVSAHSAETDLENGG